MRLQLALNVPDIDAAVDYYTRLFATEPHKRRPGYANFAIKEPALKLVLFENADADEHLNHIGVEVTDSARLAPIKDRLSQNGVLSRVDEQTTCCHATQDKLWSDGPDGLSWEWYHITDDNPGSRQGDHGTICCT